MSEEIVFGEWRLRPWTMADAPSLVRYANNRNVSHHLRDSFPFPYTKADAVAFIGRHQDESPTEHFTIASATEAVGGIGFHPQSDTARRSAEIGYWIGEPFWGQGIATAAVRAVVEYGFTTFAIVRIYAEVHEDNPVSCRVLEKAGFTLEGRLRMSTTKNGRTFDSLLYALIRL